jgi:hypothetical protein
MGNSSSDEDNVEKDEVGWVGKNLTSQEKRPAGKVLSQEEKQRLAAIRFEKNLASSRAAATFCRSNQLRNLRILSEHADMGTHSSKWHCLTTDGTINREREGKYKLIMRVITLPESGTRYFDISNSKDIQRVFNLLTSLSHQHVLGILNIAFAPSTSSAFIFTWFSPSGSLRDLIRKVSNPLLPAADKYGQPQDTDRMKPQQIIKFGAQILDGLIYLERAGLPYYHLHAGNVIIIGDNAYLSDFESSLFGLHPPLAGRLQKLKVHPQMAAFGALMLEMLTGVASLPGRGANVLLTEIQPFPKDPRFSTRMTDLLTEIFSDPSLTFADVRLMEPFRSVDNAPLEPGQLAFTRSSTAKLLKKIETAYATSFSLESRNLRSFGPGLLVAPEKKEAWSGLAQSSSQPEDLPEGDDKQKKKKKKKTRESRGTLNNNHINNNPVVDGRADSEDDNPNDDDAYWERKRAEAAKTSSAGGVSRAPSVSACASDGGGSRSSAGSSCVVKVAVPAAPTTTTMAAARFKGKSASSSALFDDDDADIF